MNYYAAQGFFLAYKKCRLHIVREGPIPLLTFYFLMPSAIHSFIHAYSFIRSFCIYYVPNTGDMKIIMLFLPSICSLSTTEEKHPINSSHTMKSAITEVTGSKRSRYFWPDCSLQEATQHSVATHGTAEPLCDFICLCLIFLCVKQKWR